MVIFLLYWRRTAGKWIWSNDKHCLNVVYRVVYRSKWIAIATRNFRFFLQWFLGLALVIGRARAFIYAMELHKPRTWATTRPKPLCRTYTCSEHFIHIRTFTTNEAIPVDSHSIIHIQFHISSTDKHTHTLGCVVYCVCIITFRRYE